MLNYNVAAKNSHEVATWSEVAQKNSEVAHLAHHIAGETLK